MTVLLLFLSAFHTSSACVSCSVYHKSDTETNRDLHVNHYCTVCANALMLPARTREDILLTDDGHDSSSFFGVLQAHILAVHDLHVPFISGSCKDRDRKHIRPQKLLRPRRFSYFHCNLIARWCTDDKFSNTVLLPRTVEPLKCNRGCYSWTISLLLKI